MRKKRNEQYHAKGAYWSRADARVAIRHGRKLLGRRLRALRVGRQLTQKKAAEWIGIHPVQVARIESAEANFMISSAFAIAFAYQVPIHELFVLDEERQ
ncbi:MAG: helix-turn-helix transcriptional regulator [Deltaproteobacteria bacterium]|nr:helix-turn-helix transcriptional regulator [Deltaproteobacteria bacterium]